LTVTSAQGTPNPVLRATKVSFFLFGFFCRPLHISRCTPLSRTHNAAGPRQEWATSISSFGYDLGFPFREIAGPCLRFLLPQMDMHFDVGGPEFSERRDSPYARRPNREKFPFRTPLRSWRGRQGLCPLPSLYTTLLLCPLVFPDTPISNTCPLQVRASAITAETLIFPFPFLRRRTFFPPPLTSRPQSEPSLLSNYLRFEN